MNESNRMLVSRRSLFRTLLQGLGISAAAHCPIRFVGAGQGEGTGTPPGPLIAHVARPFNAETPVRDFMSWLTPNERFFVRSHFGPPSPELVDPASWRLNVAGVVDRPLSLQLADLKQFQAVTITAVLQCSGNGRAFHHPKVPGVQWRRGGGPPPVTR